MIKKADVIIVSAVLLFVLFFSFFLKDVNSKGGERYACVYVDGKREYVFLLDGKKERETVKIETENGYNEIVAEGGCVYVSASDCRGNDCVNAGRISQKGELIICAPHKLMIKIEKTSGDDDVSAVTY